MSCWPYVISSRKWQVHQHMEDILIAVSLFRMLIQWQGQSTLSHNVNVETFNHGVSRWIRRGFLTNISTGYSTCPQGKELWLEYLVEVFESHHHLQLDHTFKSLIGNWYQNFWQNGKCIMIWRLTRSSHADYKTAESWVSTFICVNPCNWNGTHIVLILGGRMMQWGAKE